MIFAAGFALSRCGTAPSKPAPNASTSPASAPAPEPPRPAVITDRGSELVERAVAAMGGANAVDGIRSLEIHGKAKRIFPSGEEVPLTIGMQLLFPDRYRQTIELPTVTLTTVLAPEGAYTDMGDGPVILPEAQKTEFENGFRRNLLSLLRSRRSPGFRATALPPADRGDQVEVASGGVTAVLVLDRDSGRILQMRFTTAEGVRLSENVTDYSDWRTVAGLSYPFATATSAGGKPTNSVQLESLVVDGPLDPGVFQPKTAPVPAENTDPAPAPPVPTPTPAAG